MNWIQNDNQNVDGVDQHPKAWQPLLPLHCSTFYSIMLYSFDAVFMSDDHVWLHVEASVVSSSLVFFGNSVQKMCTSAPYHIPTKTRILGAQV